MFEWLKAKPDKSGSAIRELFTELDKDGSGAVDVKEFLGGLKAKGIPGLTNGRLMSLHADCDINGDNLITLGPSKHSSKCSGDDHNLFTHAILRHQRMRSENERLIRTILPSKLHSPHPSPCPTYRRVHEYVCHDGEEVQAGHAPLRTVDPAVPKAGQGVVGKRRT